MKHFLYIFFALIATPKCYCDEEKHSTIEWSPMAQLGIEENSNENEDNFEKLLRDEGFFTIFKNHINSQSKEHSIEKSQELYDSSGDGSGDIEPIFNINPRSDNN